jgi:hypothetical protein
MVVERRLDLVLVAHIADRHMLDQMLPEDAHFLLWGEVTSGSFHAGLLHGHTLYPLSANFPFPTEAIQYELVFDLSPIPKGSIIEGR